MHWLTVAYTVFFNRRHRASEWKMESVLTIDTSCWFALKLGGAAPVANSIPVGYILTYGLG
jgi:hypothetical protein